MTTYVYHSLDLDRISQSFQTLFWKEKNWSVACDYFQHLFRLIIYTIPFYKNLFTSTLNGSQLLHESDDRSILPCDAYDKVTHLKVSVQGMSMSNYDGFSDERKRLKVFFKSNFFNSNLLIR